jgi:hypothetical protein
VADVLAAVLIAALAYRGWVLGLRLSLIGLASVALGYLAAYVLYQPLGQILGELFNLGPISAYALGGLVPLLTVVALGFVLYRRARKQRDEWIERGWEPSALDLLGGALSGVVIGFLLSMLIAWAVVLMRGLNPEAPDITRSVIGGRAASVGSRVVYRATERATGSTVLARSAAAVARDPVHAPPSMQRFLDDDRIRGLLQDRDVRQSLVNGDPGQLDHRSLREAADDPALLDDAHRSGFLEEDPAYLSPNRARRDIADALRPIATVIGTLEDDAEVRALLEDPDFSRKLDEGNLAALVDDPRFSRIAQRVLENLRRASRPPDGA